MIKKRDMDFKESKEGSLGRFGRRRGGNDAIIL